MPYALNWRHPAKDTCRTLESHFHPGGYISTSPFRAPGLLSTQPTTQSTIWRPHLQNERHEGAIAKNIREAENQTGKSSKNATSVSVACFTDGARYASTAAKTTRHGRPYPLAYTSALIVRQTTETLAYTSPSFGPPTLTVSSAKSLLQHSNIDRG